MDDVWGDDDDEDENVERETAARDEKNLRQKHYNEGYKESLQNAREAALQGGFEAGFQIGYSEGMKAGRIIGMCSSALELASIFFTKSQEPAIQQILTDSKSLDTPSERKSNQFAEKVLRVETALASNLPADLQLDNTQSCTASK